MPTATSARYAAPFGLLLGLLALLVMPACIAYPPDGGGSSSLLIEDLNPKVVPVLIEDDGNSKDVLYSSKSKYPPKTASLDGKSDKRLKLKAKQDGAALRAVLERDFIATNATIHARVAFDPAKTKGLVDGTSLAFLELVLDTQGGADGGVPFRKLEAVFDEGSGGPLVQATDGTSPLGTPTLFPGATEVVLQFRDIGAALVLEAGPTNGPEPFDYTPIQIHSEPIADGVPFLRTVAWGVDGLGKQGTFFVNQLFLGGASPAIGVTETSIASTLSSAYDAAFHASPLFAFDLFTATASIEDARVALVLAVADIEAALGAADGVAGFQAVTEGERALKSAGKALKLAEKAKAQGDKLLAKGKTSPFPLSKKAKAASQFTQLAIVQIAGFRSSSKSKPNKVGSLLSGW